MTRLADIVIISVLVSLLFVSGASGFHSVKELSLAGENKKNEYLSTRFISESFRKTCKGNGFKDLNQWQKTCRSLWNLDYIGWCSAEDFMVDPSPESGELLYGKWIGSCGEGEVYERCASVGKL